MKVQGSSPQPGAQGVERGQDGAKKANAKGKKEGEESPFERMMRGDASDKDAARAEDARGAQPNATETAGDERIEEDARAQDALEDVEVEVSDEADGELALDDDPDGASALQEQGMAASEVRAEAADATEAAEAPREVDAVVQEMVEACFVGEDAQARKVVMLEIALPGRGMVRARIRRERDGVSVRLRAKDPETKELLRAHKDEFVKGASERGVDLKEVDIV